MKSMCHEARRNSPSVDSLQSDVTLHLDDRRGSPRPRPRATARRRRPSGVVLTRLPQLLGPEQAADVVGAEGRRRPPSADDPRIRGLRSMRHVVLPGSQALTFTSTRSPSGSSKNNWRGPPPGTSLRTRLDPRCRQSFAHRLVVRGAERYVVDGPGPRGPGALADVQAECQCMPAI